MNTDPSKLEAQVLSWLDSSRGDPQRAAMEAFRDSGFDRKCADVKEIRNLLLGLAGCKKPREVAVGSVIGRLLKSRQSTRADSIYAYLGDQILQKPIPD